jgi:hypothetical protein
MQLLAALHGQHVDSAKDSEQVAKCDEDEEEEHLPI